MPWIALYLAAPSRTWVSLAPRPSSRAGWERSKETLRSPRIYFPLGPFWLLGFPFEGSLLGLHIPCVFCWELPLKDGLLDFNITLFLVRRVVVGARSDFYAGTQAARRQWHAGDAREWTSDEEEDFADVLTYAAAKRPRFNVHFLSQPDHLATLSNPLRRLSLPTSTLCPWGKNADESDPDVVCPQEPAYLAKNLNFVGRMCEAIVSARRNGALAHHTLGAYLPFVHPYIGPDLPPLS
jgi:hypothetical protein